MLRCEYLPRKLHTGRQGHPGEFLRWASIIPTFMLGAHAGPRYHCTWHMCFAERKAACHNFSLVVCDTSVVLSCRNNNIVSCQVGVLSIAETLSLPISGRKDRFDARARCLGLHQNIENKASVGASDASSPLLKNSLSNSGSDLSPSSRRMSSTLVGAWCVHKPVQQVDCESKIFSASERVNLHGSTVAGYLRPTFCT